MPLFSLIAHSVDVAYRKREWSEAAVLKAHREFTGALL
jgi:hypothetical protein